MVSSLPLGIWFTIVECLPRVDQLCAAQISTHLCAVVRRIFYRNLELRRNNVNVQATLALLARDHTLARNVRPPEIYMAAEATQGPAWLDPDVLAGLVHIHHLELRGMPFNMAEDQLKFHNSVQISPYAEEA